MKANHEAMLRSLIEERLPDAIESVNNDLEDFDFDIFNMQKLETLIKRRIDKDIEKGVFSPEKWEKSIFDIVNKENVPRLCIKAVVVSQLEQVTEIVKDIKKDIEKRLRKWLKNETPTEDNKEPYSIKTDKLCFIPFSTETETRALLIRKTKELIQMGKDKQEKMLHDELKKEEIDPFKIDCLKICLDDHYRQLLVDILDKFDVEIASEVISNSLIKDSKHMRFFSIILSTIEIYSELSEKQKEVFNKIVEV